MLFWFRLASIGFLVLISGCFQQRLQSSISLGRAPSSIYDSCSSRIQYLFKKRVRGRLIKQMISDGDLKGLKKLFWEGHEAESYGKKKPYSRFYRKLRGWNQSHHVPAFFQTKNRLTGDVDTFSTIIRVVDNHTEIGADEKAAMEDVIGWISYIQAYRSRVDGLMEAGFEQRKQFNFLSEKIKKLSSSDFPREMDVPIVNRAGEVELSTINFESIEDLKDFIRDNAREIKFTFAQSYADETFKKSRLYNMMLDQAIYVRRLELVSERLGNTPRAKLDGDQKALKELIDEVLKDPRFQARTDAMEKVRSKEVWSEFWSTLKLWRSQRVAKEVKYTIPAKVLEQAKALSPAGVMVRSVAVFAIISGAIYTPASIIYEDNPWLKYVTGSISNRFNDFLVLVLGMPTEQLRACYHAARPWVVEEQSAMNNFIESHLSRYTARAVIDPSYNPDKDPEYLQKKLELQAICSKQRLEHGNSRRFVKNKELLNEDGYRFAAHLLFIDLVEDHHPKGRKLADLLHSYFREKELFENEDEAVQIFKEINSLGGAGFAKDLEDYRQNVAKAVPSIRKGDFKIYYPNTDEFIKALKKLPSK